MAEKSKILIIGGTGYIGKFIVEAAAKSGHPTFALVRDSSPSNPAKAQLIQLQGFRRHPLINLQGDLNDHGSLVKAIKQVDVVISTVGQLQLSDQDKIIAAIKEAGNVKVFFSLLFILGCFDLSEIKALQKKTSNDVVFKFFPSEFGNEVDRTRAVEPAKSTFEIKAKIRRAIEAAGIPYTYVSSNYFAGYSLPRTE
ncbi:hypothetical protein SASPL_106291 [Salvia splendens]|uniref:NmrA-like domain-containing protein n=1 Tax=Salvia splendens TaxID=180675 RepID=A0A8X9ABL0_SALSN|nr:hypothetical protein SASPL_106291 [Salvia splendens]